MDVLFRVKRLDHSVAELLSYIAIGQSWCMRGILFMFITNSIDKRLILIPIAFFSAITQAEVLFEDNFDAQPDWTSEMHSSATQQDVNAGDTMPVGWDSSYTGSAFGRPSVEILAEHSDKTRTGTGKSFVSWKEHYKLFSRQFASNSTLTKRIPGPNGDGVEQLYVEFWIRFSPDWTPEENLSKMFRVYSTDPNGNIQQFGSGGDAGPVLFFDYQNSMNYGSFNNTAFRGGPWGENYQPDWAPSVPHGHRNFIGDTLQQIPDKQNGGLIPIGGINGIATHEMVWGPLGEGQWTKIAFFVKMNSAPGVADGVFEQWRDDLLILKSNEVQWVWPNIDNKMVKWNAIAIGGNDYIAGHGYPSTLYPNSAEHEEWYAIDDFVISTEIPSTLMNGGAAPNPPAPPSSVEILN